MQWGPIFLLHIVYFSFGETSVDLTYVMITQSNQYCLQPI